MSFCLWSIDVLFLFAPPPPKKKSICNFFKTLNVQTKHCLIFGGYFIWKLHWNQHYDLTCTGVCHLMELN